MPDEQKSPMSLEIGHVLFIDIVGYTKLLIEQQTKYLEQLREIVRATEAFRAAQAQGKLMRLPTGDGGALVFRTSPDAPVKCAVEIARELKKHPELRVRMGIHSGPVQEVTDLSEQGNIAGAGVNIAQRVMDCGDAGHILLSKRVADDLEQFAQWRSLLHDLGTVEVKHGVMLALFNLCSDEIGNPSAPKRFASTASRDEKADVVLPVPQKSIAVLPFENLSEEKANVYFADGIQEEILTRLSRIRDLKVISRTSTQRFKNTTEPLREIAKQLGVANVLEGSVRKAGEKVRVHVQLIDADNDAHLWAERYDRDLIDIFAVESDIAAKIADALQAKLTGAEQRAISARPTSNPEAHELYLKGRYHWRNFYAPGYERVRKYFEDAIALDPSYALPYAGLSLYHSWGAANAVLPPEHWPLADVAVQKALSLDNTIPEAYNALAAVELYYKRNWSAAERAFRRGMELNPNFPDVAHHYGVCLTLMRRNAEALEQMSRAMALDPFFPGLILHYGRAVFLMRDYDRAISHFAKMLELYPDNATAHEYFGDACEKKGMCHEAITQWTAALALAGKAEHAHLLEEVFAKAGFEAAVRALAERQLQGLERQRANGAYVGAAHYVFANVRRGNIDQAFEWLPKMVEEPNWFALQLPVNPILDPLRDDPRFDKILASLVLK
jgi:TolB-like protein/class 3 adenylate cyclase/Tfp pilus assembly protein PilF